MNKKTYRILVVDNDTESIKNTVNLFKGADFTISTANNLNTAISLAKKELPQIILMELEMNDTDGIELCVEIKREQSLSNTLVVFFTSRDDDYSQIACFNAGADDYIIKKTKKSVFLSRVNALLKRQIHNNTKPLFIEKTKDTSSQLIIDTESYHVIKNGEKIIFPRKEFELLTLLANNPQKICSRKEISESIWKRDIPPENRTIDVHVRRLRKKLGEDSILTIKGLGYRLNISGIQHA